MASVEGWFAELKRRNVVRAAVVYAAAAWALAQGIAQLSPAVGLPDWGTRWFLVAALVGFPFWLALAWFYELTPEGLKRESDVAPDASITRQTGRRLDRWIIGILALAVVLLITNQFVVRHDAGVTGDEAGATAEQSVAVLPLANASGDKEQQYFSDGLTEDLINALSQFDGLKVISRNSAFQFRDSTAAPAEIGAKLGVAHLLEGSVRRQGGAVRITAELVKAADGRTLWSQHYDRPYQDLFALQDELTRAIADALKARLLSTPGAVAQNDRPPSGNLAAYTAFLRGITANDRNTESDLREAIAAFDEAIRLDPRYSAAHARLSGVWTALAMQFLGGTAARQGYAAAHAAGNTALTLDPESSLAHLVRARLLLNADMDWVGAEAEARRALQLAPNDGDAKFVLGNIAVTLGEVGRGIALTREALDTDPRRATWHYWLSAYLTALGQLDEATQATNTALALQPGASIRYEQLAIIAILRGDAAAALAAARREPAGTWQTVALALAAQIGPDRAAADAALQKLIVEEAGNAAYQVAQVYALRKDPDRMFEWLDRAWDSRDPGVGYLLFDPLVLRYRNDPRFAAFCRKVGLPATTDAKAMP
ncbi:MAG: hypothetical protein RL684_1674 [Pseudomonadota bacterium]